MWMCFVCMSVCTPPVRLVWPEGVSDPLEVELQTVVSHHVLGIKPGYSGSAVSALNH